jgi:murein DD-endopeptidase MepM/ murein hydrolase activator NlpD
MQVQRGQKIAVEGNTDTCNSGTADGASGSPSTWMSAHLHFEVHPGDNPEWKGAEQDDPELYRFVDPILQ